MDKAELNPLFVAFLYILRCLVPLALMLGVSYLLRRFGLIKETPRPPEEWNGDNNEQNTAEGGVSNG